MSANFTYVIGPDTKLTFPGKPSEDVRGILKNCGFRWHPSGGFWWKRGTRGAADFILALDKRMSPKRPDGACWGCRSPDGYFRPYGASTPVYCDACHAKHVAQEKAAQLAREARRALPPGACPKCEETRNLETDLSRADYSCERCEITWNADGADRPTNLVARALAAVCQTCGDVGTVREDGAIACDACLVERVRLQREALASGRHHDDAHALIPGKYSDELP